MIDVLLDSEAYSEEPQLGYHFYPHEVLNHPGHPRMDVVLCAGPSNLHFDPLKAQYPVSSLKGGLDKLTVSNPWRQGSHYAVGVGRIIIADHIGKTVEAFTFGGELQIETHIDRTVCALVSPAPIFPLYTSWDLSMWLTAEVEILLACLKARWHPQHLHEFEEQLAATDPFILYTCCLQAILDRSCGSNSGTSELDHRGEHFLREEVQRIKDEERWPQVCTLEQLFLSETETYS